jgi:hypothetical protein
MKSACLTDIEGITHCAFSDESGHNIGRYRSIAMVSFPHRNLDSIDEQIFVILQEAGVREFKWMKLRSAKIRFCANAFVDLVIDHVLRGDFRVDVLTWDIEDSRHKVMGRDDQENFRKMYYHLFKNVLKHRWEHPSLWRFFPDEHSSVEWENLKTFIEFELRKVRQQPSDPDDEFGLSNLVSLEGISEVQSSGCYPVQICDLFAGLGTYSRMCFSKYCQWEQTIGPQKRLCLLEFTESLSSSDKERCRLLWNFNSICKKHALGVSLQTERGLWTPNPNNPLNFWLWTPQSEFDKAPVKAR